MCCLRVSSVKCSKSRERPLVIQVLFPCDPEWAPAVQLLSAALASVYFRDNLSHGPEKIEHGAHDTGQQTAPVLLDPCFKESEWSVPSYGVARPGFLSRQAGKSCYRLSVRHFAGPGSRFAAVNLRVVLNVRRYALEMCASKASTRSGATRLPCIHRTRRPSCGAKNA